MVLYGGAVEGFPMTGSGLNFRVIFLGGLGLNFKRGLGLALGVLGALGASK